MIHPKRRCHNQTVDASDTSNRLKKENKTNIPSLHLGAAKNVWNINSTVLIKQKQMVEPCRTLTQKQLRNRFWNLEPVDWLVHKSTSLVEIFKPCKSWLISYHINWCFFAGFSSEPPTVWSIDISSILLMRLVWQSANLRVSAVCRLSIPENRCIFGISFPRFHQIQMQQKIIYVGYL